MDKADTLIRTKLHLPFTRSALVARQQLQEQISECLNRPLTLIVAPAGFGKTTLVASCISGIGLPAAWLSLDKADNQAGRFLSYLVAAIQEVDQTIGSQAAQLLRASPQVHPEAVLTSLINDLESSGEALAMVLDDYHFISNQAVHAALTFLLEHCPRRFHLVIASRSDPPLPLSRLRARGQMVELRAADLRFSEAEAAEFLNEVMGLDLDAGSVAALEERTEGWIAGLQMAAITVQAHLATRERGNAREFIESFSGTNRYILDYLLEEVLASQPVEIQHFLLHTSILERLTAALCDAITENKGSKVESNSISPFSTSDSRSILDYLERANLFLVPLDDERGWYRYHHLFADLLRARLQQTQPDLVPQLHVRASAWLEQKGLISEAIQHLLAAGEIERAADLIESYGPALLAESDPGVLLMADRLPQEMILARPKIGLYQTWLLIVQARIAKAQPLLMDLRQKLAGAEPQSGQRWMQTYITTALAFLAPASSMAILGPLPDYELLEEIPAEERLLRNAVDYLYGMALARRGDLERAVQVSLKCIQREQVPHGGASIPTLVPFLSRIYLMQGRLQDAASLCREYLDPIKERGIRFIFSTGSMKIDLGEALYEWNRLDEAEQQICDGLQDNLPWRNIMTDGFGLAALARVLNAKGDYAGAMQAVEKFESRLLEHAQPREFDEDLRTLKIRLQLAMGEHLQAHRWAEQIVLSEDFNLHPELYRLILARIWLAQGRYAEVEKLLMGTTPPPASGSQVSRQVESNLLLAAAAAGQGRLEQAAKLVDACLALAEPEGYVRVFLDAGETGRDLLVAYLRTAEAGHKLYAQKILDAFSSTIQGSSISSQQGGLIEPLTERELEILHLMALGMTNKEIARELIIAHGTVKAHTSNIYSKLEAANRTEAVARARQLDILS